MELDGQNLPFEIKDVDPEVVQERLKYFKGNTVGYLRVGPKGYFLPSTYKMEAVNIYNMPITQADIFVNTYPRSGTTWVQELVWMLASDLNYEGSEANPLSERYTFLEYSTLFHPKVKERLYEENGNDPKKLHLLEQVTESGPKKLSRIPIGSPRFVKTHLPLSLLPPTLLSTARVVYVARDPRDVAVSYYHHNTAITTQGYHGDFKNYWNLFIKNMHNNTPYFEHVKEAWNQRHEPNMLFLFYEELSKDLPAVIRKVAAFLQKSISAEQVLKLETHLNIENFRKNKSVNYDEMKQLGIITNPNFVREGKSGVWRNYFDKDMTKQADEWIANNLRNTDLQFPCTN